MYACSIIFASPLRWVSVNARYLAVRDEDGDGVRRGLRLERRWVPLEGPHPSVFRRRGGTLVLIQSFEMGKYTYSKVSCIEFHSSLPKSSQSRFGADTILSIVCVKTGERSSETILGRKLFWEQELALAKLFATAVWCRSQMFNHQSAAVKSAVPRCPEPSFNFAHCLASECAREPCPRSWCARRALPLP